MLEVRGLSKSYGNHRAVQEVSLTVQAGEVYGLLGENGAGKTTLLRMLATILQPTAGTAIVAGYDVTADPASARLKLGALFEGGLYDRLTARENVLYFARLHGLSDRVAEQRIEQLFARLTLEPYRDRRAAELSKGNRQKVALVRSIIHEPQVLLFDEPTSGLDVTASRALYDFIAEQRQTGRTVLFSSHIMTEVERVCDRVGVLHAGRLIAEDTLSGMRHQHGDNLEEAFIHLIGGGRP